MNKSKTPVGVKPKKKISYCPPPPSGRKSVRRTADAIKQVGEIVWKKFDDGKVYRGVITDFTKSERWPFTVTFSDGDKATYTKKQMAKIFKHMRKLEDPGNQPQYTPVANIMKIPSQCPILEQNRGRAKSDMDYHFTEGFHALNVQLENLTTRNAICMAGMTDDELQKTLASDFGVPPTMFDAIHGKHKELWLPVIRRELNQIVRTETFRLVKTKDIPAGKRPITGRMVLAIKRNKKGYITKLKGRFVAHGFRQQYGRDYHSTYAPTVHKPSLRTMLSVAVRNHWLLKQFDVKGAFLLSDLEYAVFLRPPKEVAKMLNMADDEVWELRKTLYGLKQSAYRWHQDFTKEMIRLGFEQCFEDPCLFRRSDKRGTLCVCVHVDDCVVSATNQRVFDEFMKAFKYPVSDCGPLEYILGLQVDYDGERLVLKQEADIEAMAMRFGVDCSHKKYTPMEVNLKLNKDMCPGPKLPSLATGGYAGGGAPCPGNVPYDKVADEKHRAQMEKIPYRNLLGALQYAAWNRPDISCAVGKCAQFANNPGIQHWKALKRILVYLHTTRKRGMVFGANKTRSCLDNLVQYWVDSDFAGDYDDAKSRTGLIVKIFGDTVEAYSRKQKACTNSTCWAETKAIAAMVRKLGFYENVLGFLGYPQSKPAHGYTDSEAAVKLQARGYCKYEQTHLRTDFHMVNEAIKSKKHTLTHISGKLNPADVLTKALPREAHTRYTRFLLGAPKNFWRAAEAV